MFAPRKSVALIGSDLGVMDRIADRLVRRGARVSRQEQMPLAIRQPIVLVGLAQRASPNPWLRWSSRTRLRRMMLDMLPGLRPGTTVLMLVQVLGDDAKSRERVTSRLHSAIERATAAAENAYGMSISINAVVFTQKLAADDHLVNSVAEYVFDGRGGSDQVIDGRELRRASLKSILVRGYV